MTYSFFSKINPIRPYWKKKDTFTTSQTLRRRLTYVATTGLTMTLPSSKGSRKEFTVIAAGFNVTVAATSPDTILGSATVLNGISGTYRALDGVWHRVS